MSSATALIVLAALLGSALIAGVFFAFSSFIMKALARLPSPEGIAAMQSINVVVLNRSFLGTFIGTALISVLIVVLSIVNWGTPAAAWSLAGAALYFFGTFLVTAWGNVPLNDRLEAVSAPDPAAARFWELYLSRWTMFNTIRTVASVAAVLMFTIGLMQSSGAATF